jgi:RNA polymerase sigma-70 factor (ECF subfamily)
VRLLRLAPRLPGAGPATETGPTDAELVALARTPDPRAAALIWDRYAGLVRGVLSRSVGPGTDVEDLLQDVFIGFFRNVRDMRDPQALKSFLVGIALRTARTALRRRRVRRWLRLTDTGELPEPTPDAPRPHDAVRRLYGILDGVGDRDRLAFVLRYAEGYELEEVAGAIGCSLATAKRCIARAEGHVLARAAKDEVLRAYVGEGEAS